MSDLGEVGELLYRDIIVYSMGDNPYTVSRRDNPVTAVPPDEGVFVYSMGPIAATLSRRDNPIMGVLVSEEKRLPWVEDTVIVPLTISGVITDDMGVPTQRKVYAVTRPTDSTAPRVLAQTLSDPVTGFYSLAVYASEEVTRVVVAEGDENPLYNDIVDRVIPG